MRADEAIPILKNDPPRNPRNTKEFEKAYDLGIEALERLCEIRKSDNNDCFKCWRLLPSETCIPESLGRLPSDES